MIKEIYNATNERINQILFGVLVSSFLGDIFQFSDFILDYSLATSLLMVFPIGPDSFLGRILGSFFSVLFIFGISVLSKKLSLKKRIQYSIYFIYFLATFIFNASQLEWGAF